MMEIKDSVFLKSTGTSPRGSKDIIPVGFVTSFAVDDGSMPSPLVSGR